MLGVHLGVFENRGYPFGGGGGSYNKDYSIWRYTTATLFLGNAHLGSDKNRRALHFMYKIACFFQANGACKAVFKTSDVTSPAWEALSLLVWALHLYRVYKGLYQGSPFQGPYKAI